MPPMWNNTQLATRMNFYDAWNDGILLGFCTVYSRAPISADSVSTVHHGLRKKLEN
jgi:hypothetical protein